MKPPGLLEEDKAEGDVLTPMQRGPTPTASTGLAALIGVVPDARNYPARGHLYL
jgi:hypothetical protein